jgi:hypothetical protein
MWPFPSYPEQIPSQVDGRTYDYVIVGGMLITDTIYSLEAHFN